MNKSKDKKVLLFSLILLLPLCMSAVISIAPMVNAAVVQIDTYAYVLLAPDPIGVGQQLWLAIESIKCALVLQI